MIIQISIFVIIQLDPGSLIHLNGGHMNYHADLICLSELQDQSPDSIGMELKFSPEEFSCYFFIVIQIKFKESPLLAITYKTNNHHYWMKQDNII